MIKNSLKAYLIHITISIISVFVFIIFNSGQPKWVSEEAAKRYHYSMMIVTGTVIAMTIGIQGKRNQAY